MIAYTETTEYPGRVGTHVTHCCGKHGCKYSYTTEEDGSCPVYSGEYEQAYACEYCHSTEHLRKQVEELNDELAWSEKLEARGLSISGYDEF